MTASGEPDNGGFSHETLFYRDERAYLAGTVPFVLDGLAAGEPVAVAVPGENLDRIQDALGTSAAEVRLIDMAVAGRNPGRIIPGVLSAFADTHPGPLRLVGEPIWAGRTAAEYLACVQHEALINVAFAGRAGTTVLCPYDARLPQPVLADAEATHPVLVDGVGRQLSSRYAPDDVLATANVPLVAPPEAAAMAFALDGLARARRFAVDLAKTAGLKGDRLDDLALAVGELTSNSVQHGGGSGVLRVWSNHDEVICEVTDAGRVTDPLAGRRPASPGQVGGRGLLLVNCVADLVRTYYGPGGTVTRLHVRTD
ncbi:sensor histidine kinase [Saccharomonospora sp. NPDC046836]|uniref:sensor histidine kinase n=1 Tax=Saccharomonospora sp. NPDC046836 TaxID=3156921 RepID=UPI0033CE97AC